MNENGVWEYDENVIRSMGTNFYEKLYEEEGHSITYLDFGMTFPALRNGDLVSLSSNISLMEVKQTLFAMGPLKAPGPNGLNPLFFFKINGMSWVILS